MFSNKIHFKYKTAVRLIFILIGITFQHTPVLAQMIHTGKPDTAKKCAVCHFQWINTFYSEQQDGQLAVRPQNKQVGTREMCISCHDGSILDSRRSLFHGYEHKIGKKPSEKVRIPEEFPLDENGLMQCATCHSPHSLPSDTEKPYGLFLREKNIGSSMCLICHKDKSADNIKGNHPLKVELPVKTDKITLNGGKIDSKNRLICETCHIPHGAPNDKLLILPVKDTASSSILCELCHSDRPALKSKDPNRSSHTLNTAAAKIEFPDKFSSGETPGRGKNSEIICMTCHKPHNSPGVEGLLITDNTKDAMCTECHKQQKKIKGSTHDLSLSSPDSKNILGGKAASTGPCTVCHLTHYGKGPLLWSRKINNTDPSPDALCLSCHTKGQPAENRLPRDYSHKTGIVLPAKMQNKNLPLYDTAGIKKPDGNISCMTCHNVHDPAPLTHEKDKKGIKHGNFLRLSKNGKTELCIHCHSSKKLITGTDHDLAFSNPDYFKQHSLKSGQTGTCSACHSAHHAKTEKFIWSAPLGKSKTEGWTTPVKTGDHLMIKLCTGCHTPDGSASGKVPVRGLHPDAFTISENIINTDHADILNDKFSFFSPDGKKDGLGNIVCSTCHDPHQWNGDKNEKGTHEKLEGNVTNSFLRADLPEILCASCHGEEGLFNFKYFHSPISRRTKKEPFPF